MTNGTVTTCTGNFYDSGGPSGNYANNENFTETFYPSTAGSMIRFTFNTFNTESGYDYLRIYNGTTTAAPLIGTYNGTTGPGTVTASNASGALTFNFTSDGSVTPAGWSASISVAIVQLFHRLPISRIQYYTSNFYTGYLYRSVRWIPYFMVMGFQSKYSHLCWRHKFDFTKSTSAV